MQKFRVLSVLLFAVLFTLTVRYWNTPKTYQSQFSGTTMGTVGYNVKVVSSEKLELKASIDSCLVAFNESLSTYIPSSEISIFNKQDSLAFENGLFYKILEKSKEVVDATDGAFDPTIGPLVNAWGFGPGNVPEAPDSTTVDSLLKFVDFQQIEFNNRIVKKPTGIYLDMSAIAKGYAVDIVGELLENRGILSYLVEIGGEVRVRGKNLEGELWSIGIDDPLVSKEERNIISIVNLDNMSLATSGNYRNYYEKDGKLFAHIIDPRTG
ncbi:MAG: FAD:protein FMN transferase, partial [Bacteroidota bacterium]